MAFEEWCDEAEKRAEVAEAVVERLNALILAVPDPAYYKPEEIDDVWDRWRGAVRQERSEYDKAMKEIHTCDQ